MMGMKEETIYLILGMWRVFRREFSRELNAPERASQMQTKKCPFGFKRLV